VYGITVITKKTRGIIPQNLESQNLPPRILGLLGYDAALLGVS
jgi:hypothetical protein